MGPSTGIRNIPRSVAHCVRRTDPRPGAFSWRPARTSTSIQDVTPATPEGCTECLRDGGKWVHLRECLSCGHIGCCDSSPNGHATAHYHESDHPVIQSFEPGENWRWCYIDAAIV